MDLIPKCPVKALEMRNAIAKFEKLKMSIFVAGRGEDEEKLNEFAEAFPANNEFAAALAQGKWLMGTDEPTLLDIYAVPFYEMVYNMRHGPMGNIYERVAASCPNVWELVRKF